jgi:PAS domain S-box-containing protein
MSHPGLWLYLLAAVTILVIALRRVLQRQKPLSDELYSKQVAIEHVHSGVAWIRADGTMGSVNSAMAKMLHVTSRELIGRDWQNMFTASDRERVLEVHRQALLMGKANVETSLAGPEGSVTFVNMLLVTVHDHKSRLIGHYCLVEDRTNELELQAQLSRLAPAATV